MTRYCRKCGAENADDAVYCIRCGESFEKRAVEEKLGLGDIIEKAFHFIKENPRVFLVYVAVSILLQIFLFSVFFLSFEDDLFFEDDFFSIEESEPMIEYEEFFAVFAVLLVFILFSIIVQIILYCFIIFSTRDYLETGESSLSSALKDVLSRVLSLMLFSVLIFVVGLVIVIIPFVFSVAMMLASPVLGFFFLIILLLAAAVVLLFLFLFAYQAFLIDNCGYIGSLERSWQLARRYKWDVIPLFLVFFVLSLIAGIVFFPIMLLTAGNIVAYVILNLFVLSAINGFITVWMIGSYTMLYMNRRNVEYANNRFSPSPV